MSNSNRNVVTFLTRATFKKPPVLKFEDVSLPEYGEGAVMRISELNAEAAQDFGEKVGKEADKFAMPLWIIAAAREVVQQGFVQVPKVVDGKTVFVQVQKVVEGVPVEENGQPVMIDSDTPVMVDGDEPLFVTGGPLFEDTPETRQEILNMGASVVMRLGQAALRLNGFTKEETDKETKN